MRYIGITNCMIQTTGCFHTLERFIAQLLRYDSYRFIYSSIPITTIRKFFQQIFIKI